MTKIISDFTISISTSKTAAEVYQLLLQPKKWWSGIYHETIDGASSKVNDEFTFEAGGGAHYSRQKLTAAIPAKKIEWQVTESNLSFLKNPAEWEGTYIRFELAEKGENTKITFTHKGLVPDLESYDGCADAWTKYMNNLVKKLN